MAPYLIQMSGAPGSGKSTIAALLRTSLPTPAAVLDHDVLRSTLLESGTPFSAAATLAYKLQWSLARDLMTQGLTLIVDSPCNSAEVVENGSALAAELGFEYWYVECRVRRELMDRRLRARAEEGARPSQRTGVERPPAARADEAGREEEVWDKVPCRPGRNVVVVDSEGEPEALRDEILARIQGGNSAVAAL